MLYGLLKHVYMGKENGQENIYLICMYTNKLYNVYEYNIHTCMPIYLYIYAYAYMNIEKDNF